MRGVSYKLPHDRPGRLAKFPLEEVDVSGTTFSYRMPRTLKKVTLTGGGYDLANFNGTPLEYLDITGGACDLSRLGVEVKTLVLNPGASITGLDRLRAWKILETVGVWWIGMGSPRHANIEEMPAAEFWQRYDAGEFKDWGHDAIHERIVKAVRQLATDNGFEITDQKIEGATKGTRLDLIRYGPPHDLYCLHDLSALEGLPLTHLSFRTRLGEAVDFSPLRNMPLRNLTAHGPGETDLEPLEGHPSLRSLALYGSQERNWEILSTLRLQSLQAGGSNIRDLNALGASPIRVLQISYCPNLVDVEALETMSLRQISLSDYPAFSSLEPLRGMRGLRLVDLQNLKKIEDLGPLGGLDLSFLSFPNTQVRDLAPIHGMPLEAISLPDTATDLTPLQAMPLKSVTFSPKVPRKGLELLRNIPTIETFGGPGRPPEQFWKRYDAGEFGKPVPDEPPAASDL